MPLAQMTTGWPFRSDGRKAFDTERTCCAGETSSSASHLATSARCVVARTLGSRVTPGRNVSLV